MSVAPVMFRSFSSSTSAHSNNPRYIAPHFYLETTYAYVNVFFNKSRPFVAHNPAGTKHGSFLYVYILKFFLHQILHSFYSFSSKITLFIKVYNLTSIFAGIAEQIWKGKYLQTCVTGICLFGKAKTSTSK